MRVGAERPCPLQAGFCAGRERGMSRSPLRLWRAGGAEWQCRLGASPLPVPGGRLLAFGPSACLSVGRGVAFFTLSGAQPPEPTPLACPLNDACCSWRACDCVCGRISFSALSPPPALPPPVFPLWSPNHRFAVTSSPPARQHFVAIEAHLLSRCLAQGEFIPPPSSTH